MNSTFTDGPNNHETSMRSLNPTNIDFKAFKANQNLFYQEPNEKTIDFDDNRSQQSFYENEHEISHPTPHEFKKCITKAYENFLDYARSNNKQQRFSIENQSDAGSDCYESKADQADIEAAKNTEDEDGEVSPQTSRNSSKHNIDSNSSLDSNWESYEMNL